MTFEDNEYKANHLQELGDSDFEIVDGEPDITGWGVFDTDGQKIGEVDDMLFDTELRKVRYLVVELQDEPLGLPDGRRVLIPIGVAALRSSDGYESDSDDAILANDPRLDETVIEVNDSDNHLLDRGTYTSTDDEEPEMVEEDEDEEDEEDYEDVVIVPATAAQLLALPEYVKDQMSPVMEVAILQIFQGDAATSATEYDRNGFYEHEYFDVDKFYDRGATTRSNLPVSEDSLDEPLAGNTDRTEPPTENPFDKDIEREEPGLGKPGY